jgi:hypothetical protein
LADARAAAHQDLNAVLATATQAHTPPDGAALTGLADQLEQIVASESPEQAKELMGLLLKEIRVHDGRRIVPTYRVPAAVRAIPSKVELGGLEPPTSWVRCRRGSCTTASNQHGLAVTTHSKSSRSGVLRIVTGHLLATASVTPIVLRSGS